MIGRHFDAPGIRPSLLPLQAIQFPSVKVVLGIILAGASVATGCLGPLCRKTSFVCVVDRRILCPQLLGKSQLVVLLQFRRLEETRHLGPAFKVGLLRIVLLLFLLGEIQLCIVA